MVIINNNNNIKETLLPLLPGGSSIILSSPSSSLSPSRGSSSKNSISALDKLGNLVVVYTLSSGGAASFGTSGAGSAIIDTVSIPARNLCLLPPLLQPRLLLLVVAMLKSSRGVRISLNYREY